MKYAIKIAAAVVLSQCASSYSFAAGEYPPYDGYLLTYFTGNRPWEETLKFSYSLDGRRFNKLNAGNSVIDASHTEMGGLRDPYIYRGQDGSFYMTATDMQSWKGWGSNRGIVLMKSPDLIHWKSSAINFEKRFPDLFPGLHAAWAPQVAYNPLTDRNMVYLTVGANEPYKAYYAHANRDFTALAETPRQLFYSRDGVGYIDYDITEQDGKYHMLMKAETSPPGSTARLRVIKHAVSDHLTWGYILPSQDDVQRTSNAVEGPQAYRLNDGSGYIVMYDNYLNGGFQLVKTTDFKTFTPVSGSDINQLSPRHAGIISLTSDELHRVLDNDTKITVENAAPSSATERQVQAAPSAGRGDRKDLGTLKADNGWASEIWGLSATGSVAVGDSYTDNNGPDMRAAAWSGTDLSQKQDLGTLRADNTGAAKAYAVSKDGAVIGGIAENADQRLHAVTWSGTTWATKTDLGTLTSDQSGTSGVYALSGDGRIAAGESSVDSGTTHAALWSGQNWSVKTDLGSLRSDNSGMSWAYALSKDGAVVGGYAAPDRSVDVYSHATLWSGANWATKTDLGTLKSDNRGTSVVRALSADGTVAAGSSTTDSGYTHAALWSGSRWSDKRDLGTLRADNSGSSWVRALSADGRIAGGMASTSSGFAHGVVWFGDGWRSRTDLGTLRADGGGVSEVQALSADGRVAAGYSETDSGDPHAVLWKITYPTTPAAGPAAPQAQSQSASQAPAPAAPASGQAPTQPPATTQPPAQAAAANAAPTPAPASEPGPAVPSSPSQAPVPDPTTPAPASNARMQLVDVTNTRRSVSRLRYDTFSVLELQRQSLASQQQTWSCSRGSVCWSASAGFISDGSGTDTLSTLPLSYGLTDHLTVGAHFSYAPYRALPSPAFNDTRTAVGAGTFVNWQQPYAGGAWYLRSAFAASQYHADIRRLQSTATEAGTGGARIGGLAGTFEFGQSLPLFGDLVVGWHGGVRTSRITRQGYTEANVSFPVQYDGVVYRSTLAYLGADVSVPLTTNLSWISGIEVEQAVRKPTMRFAAHADYIGDFKYGADLTRTRGEARTGLKFGLGNSLTVSATTSVRTTALGTTAIGGLLSFGGEL
ncbi:family 43 glycosylhydrolase [Methylobacterium sp. J-077]|uniref:family 43 glycosylhydrolase n=1 Tax=Methylobacterium sp. J-077 TaxID=2836656 RepID=UPI001FB97038|nr:family 43 glycosylhydrolase [Methylobacterium sp. J-077]MCJ2125228.1 family 43 glycosylhydrolase [Methylobacterium sp. J-077]